MSLNKNLQIIPGVGPSLAQDLIDLGIRSVADLKNKNPENLYEKLMALRGQHIDRGVYPELVEGCSMCFDVRYTLLLKASTILNYSNGGTGKILDKFDLGFKIKDHFYI